jgi:hypothetical protein
MRDTTFTLVCLSLIAISQFAMIFVSKPLWIEALSAIGITLAMVGIALAGYYRHSHAKYFLSIPGVVLVGISATLQVARLMQQILTERHLRRAQ